MAGGEDRSCLERFSTGLFGGAAAGVLLGSAMLAWYPDPYEWDVKNTRRPRALGFSHFFSGLQRPVVLGSLVCATYAGVECAMAQFRNDDRNSTWVNSAAAGAASGMVLTSTTGRFGVMASTALGLGLLMGMVEFNAHHTRAHYAITWLKKWYVNESLPIGQKESEVLKGLKEKYPEYKDL